MSVKTAIILAAGRGQRMQHLTQNTPKPLLKVQGKTLIEHQIQRLVSAGIERIVINTAYLGHMISDHLGDGTAHHCTILYSDEGEQALETAGGIINALPLIKDEVFIATNADIWTDYSFKPLTEHTLNHQRAHLVLVPNPDHNPAGDFSIEQGLLGTHQPKYTFAGIGLYHRDFFKGFKAEPLALKTPLLNGITQHTISAELYHGRWYDIGTPERLDAINQILTTHSN